jgi:hypothetical protein
MTAKPQGMLKPLATTLVIFLTGIAGVIALAPERRHGLPPEFMRSGPDEDTVTPVAFGKIGEEVYPAVISAFDPGAPAQKYVVKGGGTAYEYAKPSTMTLLWLEGGKPQKDGNGEILGMRIDVPRGCIDRAESWVGHALPVKETQWRLANNEVRTLQDRKAVIERVCGGTQPDADYDRENIAE